MPGAAVSRLTEIPAERLGWLRVIVSGYALWHVGRQLGLYRSVASASPEMFRGVGVTSLLDGPLAPDTFMGVVYATLALNALFLVGWRTRLVGPLFSAALLFVLTYRTSWVQIYHSDNLMALQVLILGFAPAAGDAVSLDARAGRAPARERWEVGWPVLLMCAVTTFTYLLAGAAKVAGSAGWAWALGTNLRDQIAYDALNKELLGLAPNAAAYWAFQHPMLMRPGSVGALILELGAPFALLSRRLGMAWSVATCGMHWGIYLLMGIAFTYPMHGVAFACFFPWERVAAWMARSWGALRAVWSGHGAP